MNRRQFLRSGLTGMAGLTMTPLALITHEAFAQRAPTDMPNIILIMADDMGVEALECYGSLQTKTPNLNKMASMGMKFEHCYAQPLCTPSRVQIMTGQYNDRNYEGFGGLNPKEVTFANFLKTVGYRTCIAGKWQLGWPGYESTNLVSQFGFDESCVWNMRYGVEPGHFGGTAEGLGSRYYNPNLYINGVQTEFAKKDYGPDVCTNFITRFIRDNANAPFFVYYPMLLTHEPFHRPPIRSSGSEFHDMVHYADLLVGRIMQQLEDSGLSKNTLVLFTADNGTVAGVPTRTVNGVVRGGKADMTDAGTHVPLLAQWPGVVPAGVTTNTLVDFTDFLPTLVDTATGIKIPRPVIDGQSFLPQLKGVAAHEREWVFCHYSGTRSAIDGRGKAYVRNQRWKLYDSGQFYDVSKDRNENRPINQKRLNTMNMAERTAALAAREQLTVALANIKAR
ncbi:sulfatase-like hydrolase/transferase [Thiofilum flexile]|uniref:sulfatase-like hydrolase/transferase n=1 Tax=Thiofilum flexile TaxID=125627 RepID=UPI000367CD6A|nr:sulfatase-like hydrolase/transferase [Thiofilum flexile]